MRVRPYREGDAARMLEIFQRAVKEIGSRFYSPAQVEAWGGGRVTEERLHALYTDGRATFIGETEDGLAVGFSDLEADGHIDMLYCDPDHAGQGYARMLVEAAVAEAQACGLPKLHTEASEAARPVFERAGFVARFRRDLNIDGVDIHNWAMEKRLP